MSTEVKHCFESDEIGDLAQNMADEEIRRLPLLNDKNRLVGIVSLGDLATSRDGRATQILDKPFSFRASREGATRHLQSW